MSEASETHIIAAEAGSTPDGHSFRSRRARRLSAWPTLVSIVTLMVGSVFLSAAHVHYFPVLSPVDELQHIDYLYRAPEFIRAGDKVEQDAMREEACRGMADYPTPPCLDAGTYDPAVFQEQGTNTAAIYTPLYYTITKIVATPVTWILGLGSLVTAGRIVSGFWLAAGLVVTFMVALRLGAHRAPTVAMLLAAAATPVVILPAATITPDASALLVGASLVWSALWWDESPRRRLWLVTLLSLAAVALKALNIIVVVLVAAFLVLRYLQCRDCAIGADGEGGVPRRTPHHGPRGLLTLTCIASISAVSLAGGVGYVLFTQAHATDLGSVDTMGARLSTSVVPVQGLLTHVGAFIQVFYTPGWYITVPIVGPAVQQIVSLFTFAGTFAAAFLIDRMSRVVRSLAGALLVVGVVGAPMIIAFNYIASGVYIPIPGRYALTLVPAGLAVACATVQRRSAQVVCVLVGSLLYLITLGWLIVH